MWDIIKMFVMNVSMNLPLDLENIIYSYLWPKDATDMMIKWVKNPTFDDKKVPYLVLDDPKNGIVGKVCIALSLWNRKSNSIYETAKFKEYVEYFNIKETYQLLPGHHLLLTICLLCALNTSGKKRKIAYQARFVNFINECHLNSYNVENYDDYSDLKIDYYKSYRQKVAKFIHGKDYLNPDEMQQFKILINESD